MVKYVGFGELNKHPIVPKLVTPVVLPYVMLQTVEAVAHVDGVEIHRSKVVV
ncbi:hypothetical protein FSS13T_12600 [Flavobacterium saliperosum S13]|uniref:Uncharacterized protein n=1 Tax=Flavobacterium saliperosum S13 TaxID=1341155 RepID=A0ABP2ZZS2_9FLAO|nr:hypothetical protein FSS13T_12600 [Flavobacterium saliperosum S13]